MNIIFVDIDGPLLPQKMDLFHQNRKTGKENPPMFDEFAVRVFNLWAKYGNAKIVFSTNWALSWSADELKEIMRVNGLGFDYHEHCITPKRFRQERHSEILNWLDDHSKEGDKFIAVDDDTSCRYIEQIMKHPQNEVKATGEWIEVEFQNGISWQNFLDGCEALDINLEDINFHEFGIKILTDEEKEQRKKDLDLLARSLM